MSSAKFQVTARIFPGQHIRNYPGSTRTKEEDVLYLEAKQYTPLSNQDPQDGDVTIIATCASGFPKEMYEPLWDELVEHCQAQGMRIRAIWCVDKSDHGASGVLNEKTQGDDPSFYDHARDILHMTNVFREYMPSPLVGIGHSIGATTLIELAHIHPRLFSSLVLTDPIVGPEMKALGVVLVHSSNRRPDLWESREEAEKAFRSAKPLRSWDPRVLDLWLQHGLRETPTMLYPAPGKITLRMSKAHEAWNIARPYFDGPPSGSLEHSLIKYPDSIDGMVGSDTFYRPETMSAWTYLPQIRASVLYLCPEKGPLRSAKSIEEKVARTGSGAGGSGGEKYGRTSKEILEGAGHLAPFEKPGECAKKTAEWLAKDLAAWQERWTFERQNRDDKSINQVGLSEEWMRRSKEWFDGNMAKPKGKPKL